MKLGLFAGYWGMGLWARSSSRWPRRPTDLGYDSIWAAEAYGSDAATVLAWMPTHTEHAKLASGIFQMPPARRR